MKTLVKIFLGIMASFQFVSHAAGAPTSATFNTELATLKKGIKNLKILDVKGMITDCANGTQDICNAIAERKWNAGQMMDLNELNFSAVGIGKTKPNFTPGKASYILNVLKSA